MPKYGLIRYPGSKAKLWRPIIDVMPEEISMGLWSEQSNWEYREPFFGSGAIGFRILDIISSRSRVWINDKDYWLVCLWKSIQDSPGDLVDLIRGFRPTPQAFFEFKEQDGDTSIDVVKAGFQKLALHQMSVSGFGVKSGTCLGGREQTNSEYPISCRWNPIRLIEHVSNRHRQFKRFGSKLKITCRDFQELITTAHSKCFLYLDPPYVEKGGMLYKHSMSEEQHCVMADLLRKSPCRWIVSYDDHELVRSLYSDFRIDEIDVRYSNATHASGVRPKNREVVISNTQDRVPTT